MKGKTIDKKNSWEYGKKVWILINKEGEVVERFNSKCNANKFKNNYPDELKIERI